MWVWWLWGNGYYEPYSGWVMVEMLMDVGMTGWWCCHGVSHRVGEPGLVAASWLRAMIAVTILATLYVWSI